MSRAGAIRAMADKGESAAKSSAAKKTASARAVRSRATRAPSPSATEMLQAIRARGEELSSRINDLLTRLG